MKVAVSIPDEVFEAAEKASRRLRVSRSRFYADAVRAYAHEHSGEEITRKLDAIYSEETEGVPPEAEPGSLEVLRSETW